MGSTPGSASHATASAADEGARGRPSPPSIAWLDDLPPAAAARLAPAIARLDLDAGVTFMREGDATSFLAIVLSGRVALRMRVPDRGAITILTLEADDIVGWSAIVPPYRATTSATTLEPTELAIIDAGDLRAALLADSELAAALLPRVLETIADRLAATRDQLLDLFHSAGVDPW